MAVSVKVTSRVGRINRALTKGVTDAFEDVVLDIERVSSESAPHDTGFLEKNKVRQFSHGSNLEAEIVFNAITDRGFNYAEFMHDGKYKLGPGSKRKPGGTLAYGGGRIPVGPGYLNKTVENGGPGYIEHLKKGFTDAL